MQGAYFAKARLGCVPIAQNEATLSHTKEEDINGRFPKNSQSPVFSCSAPAIPRFQPPLSIPSLFTRVITYVAHIYIRTNTKIDARHLYIGSKQVRPAHDPQKDSFSILETEFLKSDTPFLASILHTSVPPLAP